MKTVADITSSSVNQPQGRVTTFLWYNSLVKTLAQEEISDTYGIVENKNIAAIATVIPS